MANCIVAASPSPATLALLAKDRGCYRAYGVPDDIQ